MPWEGKGDRIVPCSDTVGVRGANKNRVTAECVEKRENSADDIREVGRNQIIGAV